MEHCCQTNVNIVSVFRTGYLASHQLQEGSVTLLTSRKLRNFGNCTIPIRICIPINEDILPLLVFTEVPDFFTLHKFVFSTIAFRISSLKKNLKYCSGVSSSSGSSVNVRWNVQSAIGVSCFRHQYTLLAVIILLPLKIFARFAKGTSSPSSFSSSEDTSAVQTNDDDIQALESSRPACWVCLHCCFVYLCAFLSQPIVLTLNSPVLHRSRCENYGFPW